MFSCFDANSAAISGVTDVPRTAAALYPALLTLIALRMSSTTTNGERPCAVNTAAFMRPNSLYFGVSSLYTALARIISEPIGMNILRVSSCHVIWYSPAATSGVSPVFKTHNNAACGTPSALSGIAPGGIFVVRSSSAFSACRASSTSAIDRCPNFSKASSLHRKHLNPMPNCVFHTRAAGVLPQCRNFLFVPVCNEFAKSCHVICILV